MMKIKNILPITLFFLGFNAFASVQIATFPEVPESWDVKIIGNTVEYSSPTTKTQRKPATTLRFTYSKATATKDAKTLIDDYSKENNCKNIKTLGKGFYSASCSDLARDVIIVGEVNNAYTIEISGDYSKIAVDMINKYLNQIINGKRTFEDRDIGENVK